MSIFEELESEVRSYCRNWPAVFDRALGSRIYDEHGRGYIDFFAGAGALNYGHNNPELKAPLLEYLASDRVVHSLDMHTVAKREFLETFDELILRPRDLHYRVQFPGPGGTNAVEAALKVARKATGRTEVIYFTNGFHGMTLGALAVTGNGASRAAAGTPLVNTTPLPYDGALGFDTPDFAWFDRLMSDGGSGVQLPAAIIVESVQGEGGINVSRPQWLRQLADRCRAHEIPLILDDVQMGCGRTGPFFSFEWAGITPDIVCLSKSIGGYGLPLALTLIRPDLDVWEPGEHTGTFRGIDPALVAGAAALRTYWSNDRLQRRTEARGLEIADRLRRIAQDADGAEITVDGRGMVHGLSFAHGNLAEQVSVAAYERGLLVETAGPEDQVVKLLPALTISDEDLDEGLTLLADAVAAIC
jgi:diaminobutyrate-2-oxoglutarate transaminase